MPCVAKKINDSLTIDTREGLETPYAMIRSRHTHKNGVLLYETVFVKNIIVKLTVLMTLFVIAGL